MKDSELCIRGKITRLSSLFLLIVCFSLSLAGCILNISIGTPSEDTAKETTSSHENDTSTDTSIYQSRATVYISSATATEASSISSSDLVVSWQLVDTYTIILQSNSIQNKLHEKYPEFECALTLESVNQTEIFAIIATSENPEYLEDLCNMAVSLFCAELPQVVEGISCKVVNSATPALLIETS